MTSARGAVAGAVLFGSAAAIVLARLAAAAYPTGDIALIELYTREALAGRLLEGPYSHFPWHHPGPLCFYLLAPFYLAGGRTTAALSAGAVFIGLVSVAAIVWMVSRGRSLGIALLIVACIAAYVLRVDRLLVSAWNAHIVVLPAAAALVAAAGVASGDIALVPFLIVVVSFVVQTDVALAPTLMACSLAAALACASHARASVRQLAAAAALLSVLWLPVIVEQIWLGPGNLTALSRFFTSGNGTHQTFAASLAAWSSMIAAPYHADVVLPTGGALSATPGIAAVGACGLTLAAMGAAFVSIRAGDRWLASLAGVSALASLAALWSVTRIDGTIADHQVFWISIVGVLEAAAVLSVTARNVRLRAGLPPIAITVVMLILTASALTGMNRVRQGSAPVTIFLPSIANFGDSIREHLQRNGVTRPLVRIGQEEWGVTAGILLQLNRLGVPFSVEDSWASMFPAGMREKGTEDFELTIVAAGTHSELSQRDGDVMIDRSTHVDVHGRRLTVK
jgi:hypothetical protein